MRLTWLLASTAARRPNVVLFIADDMGIGDVCAYHADWNASCGSSGLATPHIDHLAADGARFTHAHSGAALCAPSRLSILTGSLAMRGAGLGQGFGAWVLHAPSALRETQRSLGDLFHDAGYATAFVGKHHLGGGLYRTQEPEDPAVLIEAGTTSPPNLTVWDPEVHALSQVDHLTQGFVRGPSAMGFGYSFLTSSGIQSGPYLYYENERAVDITEDRSKGEGGWSWQRATTQPQLPKTDCLPERAWCGSSYRVALLPPNEAPSSACLSGMCKLACSNVSELHCGSSLDAQLTRIRGTFAGDPLEAVGSGRYGFRRLALKGWDSSRTGEIYAQVDGGHF